LLNATENCGCALFFNSDFPCINDINNLPDAIFFHQAKGIITTVAQLFIYIKLIGCPYLRYLAILLNFIIQQPLFKNQIFRYFGHHFIKSCPVFAT